MLNVCQHDDAPNNKTLKQVQGDGNTTNIF